MTQRSIESRVAVLEEQSKAGGKFHDRVEEIFDDLKGRMTRIETLLESNGHKPRSRTAQGGILAGVVAAIAAVAYGMGELARLLGR